MGTFEYSEAGAKHAPSIFLVDNGTGKNWLHLEMVITIKSSLVEFMLTKGDMV